jgi:transposase InsO family protein
MDAVGPSRVRSMGGKWYVLVIVDDYSHYSCVFFLESKDEVFEHFQSLALRLNNEHPNCLKSIHSDNETEFRNVSFDKFCLEYVIDQQFFTPCVVQQNGVMKRKNHTLIEMARMMLDEHKTPRRFWADAISTTCYISNRVGFGLSVAPQNPRRKVGVGHASRSSGLLHMEASLDRVSQSGLKTSRGARAGGASGTIAEVMSEAS